MTITATIVVWEVGKAGFTATNPLALSTLNDKRLTAVRNELKQTKAELDALLAVVHNAPDAKQTIKETVSVTPIKDELQKQGEKDVQQVVPDSSVPLGYQKLQYSPPAPKVVNTVQIRKAVPPSGAFTGRYDANSAMFKPKPATKPVQPPMLVITHLLKGGGSTVASLLKGMGMEFRGIRHSSIAMPVKYQGANAKRLEAEAKVYETAIAKGGGPAIKMDNYFNVGMARNPCSYLLSVWNFQRKGGHGEFPFDCQKKAYKGDIRDLLPEKGLSTEESIRRFRKWVRVSVGKTTKIHLFSLREYYALEPKIDRAGWDDGQYFACLHDVSESEEEKIAAKLDGFDWASHYDCIVHTENIAEDVKQCTYKYADWITQDRGDTQTAGTADDWHIELEDQVDKANMTKLAGYTNNMNHYIATCQDFYDRETMDFVWQREGKVAQGLGYQACCDESLHKQFY